MQGTFAEYTARTAFARPLLSGVAYAQRVINSERGNFERQNGWTIKTMEREPSPVQDEYAPVIFSQESFSYFESLDMMSGEVLYLTCLKFMVQVRYKFGVSYGLQIWHKVGRQRKHFESESYWESRFDKHF